MTYSIKRISKLCIVACAACAMAFVLASCAGGASDQQPSPAEQNRTYMSAVNRISSEAADDLAGFSDAVNAGDVAAMRLAAADAAKTLEKISTIAVPDAMQDIQKEYLAGASDLSTALSDYVELYAQAQNGSVEGIDTSEVRARYESGIEHLSKADSMVAELGGADAQDTGTANQGQDQPEGTAAV